MTCSLQHKNTADDYKLTEGQHLASVLPCMALYCPVLLYIPLYRPVLPCMYHPVLPCLKLSLQQANSCAWSACRHLQLNNE